MNTLLIYLPNRYNQKATNTLINKYYVFYAQSANVSILQLVCKFPCTELKQTRYLPNSYFVLLAHALGSRSHCVNKQISPRAATPENSSTVNLLILEL